MTHVKDITGQRFGRWTVLAFEACVKGHAMFTCKCDCGTQMTVCGSRLRRGNSKSCGCARNEQFGKRSTIHGHSNSPTYITWSSMISRCHQKNHDAYERYGAKGIRVCAEWREFKNFLADMGERPSARHTIDRIDNTKGYSKDNCRWADMLDQQRNKSSNVIIEFNGIKGCISEVCEKFGISANIYHTRKRKGWTLEEIFTTPVRPKLPKGQSQRRLQREIRNG